ncbi:MAG: glycosyltransferase [Muribaculaceae bacterium]|nr:glycosyltransferase [Muribaculaceae bacterium]MDE7033298.1 glycosyltransferase [Muribaculaceae bacterium]
MVTFVFIMKLHASIVTYHTDCAELRKCIDSLLADSGAVGRVYVVDNSSSESTAAVCAEYSGIVKYIPHPNTGYGDAHNVALHQSIEAGTVLHLVINSDVYFRPGTLTACVAYMADNPEVVQLIPHTVYPDGSEQYVIHPLPTPLDMFMRGFLPESWLKRRRRRYQLRDRDPKATINAPYHHGCFMLLRTAAVARVGLFDPRFFMYPEDIDLTRRMHRIGRTVYWPGAEIVHAHRAESKRSGRMRRIHITNMLRYFRKWGFFFDPERRQVNRRLMKEYNTKGLSNSAFK